jgi:hypothetical protein
VSISFIALAWCVVGVRMSLLSYFFFFFWWFFMYWADWNFNVWVVCASEMSRHAFQKKLGSLSLMRMGTCVWSCWLPFSLCS